MGQSFCRPTCCSYICAAFGCLVKETGEPKYARYQSTSEEEITPEDIIGSFLELDPVLNDHKTGEDKINQWLDENASHLGLPESDIEINRLKCVKYWEAVLGNDISKVNDSTVNFCFEKKSEDEMPHLVIEHRGKSVFIRNASKRASHKDQPTYTRPLVKQPSSDGDL